MEDVLVREELPDDARSPTVCLDENPVVLHAEVRPGLPPAPGPVERRDDEYERHGTAHRFVLGAPLAGWRHVAVTEHRTKPDYAAGLRSLVEEHDRDAARIEVVHDNRTTHTAGARYATFPPQQARTILDRLEVHPPPKPGSWLHQAEIASSVFARGGLARPVPDKET